MDLLHVENVMNIIVMMTCVNHEIKKIIGNLFTEIKKLKKYLINE